MPNNHFSTVMMPIMINSELAFISAFILGLASSTHCLGMCGGIAAAFGLTVQSRTTTARLARLMAYNTGRITTYVLLGVLAGYFASQLAAISAMAAVLRVLAGLMLLAMACYIGQWWMGLTVIERWGQAPWRYIQPLSARLLPLQSISAAYVFGLLWGLLPCGLVYSMLVWVAGRGQALESGLLMLAFGLGTLPALVLSGLAAQQFKTAMQSHGWRQGMATLLLIFALWTLYAAFHH